MIASGGENEHYIRKEAWLNHVNSWEKSKGGKVKLLTI
jgi:hypothetical protein